VNWKSADDNLGWLNDVKKAGRYTVSLDCICPIADAGSTVELRFKEVRLVGTVTPGWDPPLYTN
jgi:hypothetical protein